MMKVELKDTGPYVDIRPLPDYRARFWTRPLASSVSQRELSAYSYLEWQLTGVRDVREAQAWVDDHSNEYEECTLYASAPVDGTIIWLRVSGWDPNRAMWDSRESFES